MKLWGLIILLTWVLRVIQVECLDPGITSHLTPHLTLTQNRSSRPVTAVSRCRNLWAEGHRYCPCCSVHMDDLCVSKPSPIPFQCSASSLRSLSPPGRPSVAPCALSDRLFEYCSSFIENTPWRMGSHHSAEHICPRPATSQSPDLRKDRRLCRLCTRWCIGAGIFFNDASCST